jgi:hypothetical protein
VDHRFDRKKENWESQSEKSDMNSDRFSLKRLVRFLNRQRFMEIWFGQWQWIRRACGGQWECWWVDVCGSSIWMQHNSKIQGRIPCTRGIPLIEVEGEK